jgi:hypothetical protein
MRTRENVIDFIRSESVNGNSIAYATIGQGGAGLEVSSYDFSDDLEDMDFDGIVEPCDDIKGWAEYDENMYSVYQFSDDSGLKYQIVTF